MNDYCFRAMPDSSLRAAGLGPDWVDVVFVNDELIMASPSVPRRVFPLAGISRVRFGYVEGRFSGNRYRMKVWSADAPQPMLLETIHADEPGFASISRRLATALWATHGAGAVEGGVGWIAALAFVTWMTGGMAIIGAVFGYQAAHDLHHKEPLWPLLIVLPLAALIIGVLLWFFYRPYRPRRLSTPAALDRVLPARDQPDR